MPRRLFNFGLFFLLTVASALHAEESRLTLQAAQIKALGIDTAVAGQIAGGR